MKRPLIILSFSLLFFFIGCSEKEPPNAPPNYLYDELIKSPTAIQIDSIDVELSIFLWRDYMPISPPNGNPLAANIRIGSEPETLYTIIDGNLVFIGLDYSDAIRNLDADKMWVFNKNSVWEANLESVGTINTSYVNKSASGGPLWETGILVDAVVRLVQDDSTYFYIKKENIEIHRTD